ncbi:hypothetical protein VTN96DRAFT_35 [Rasamsonia emersonii]
MSKFRSGQDAGRMSLMALNAARALLGLDLGFSWLLRVTSRSKESCPGKAVELHSAVIKLCWSSSDDEAGTSRLLAMEGDSSHPSHSRPPYHLIASGSPMGPVMVARRCGVKSVGSRHMSRNL